MNKFIALMALALCMGSTASHAAYTDLTTFVSSGTVEKMANVALLKNSAGGLILSSALSGNVVAASSFDWYYHADSLSYSGAAVVASGISALPSILFISLYTSTDTGWQTFVFATPYTGSIEFQAQAISVGPTDAILYIKNLVVEDAVSPVPEAETYVMLLAGLTVMGAIVRRREAKMRFWKSRSK